MLIDNHNINISYNLWPWNELKALFGLEDTINSKKMDDVRQHIPLAVQN